MITRRSWRRSILTAAGLQLAGLLACGDLLQEPDTGIANLVSIEVESGNFQTGESGATLGEPLRARVSHQGGGPVEGLRVEWEVVEGNGSVEPRNGFTDEAGIVEATWTLGTAPSRQLVMARFAGDSARFEANLE